jgi:hypothetical protein
MLIDNRDGHRSEHKNFGLTLFTWASTDSAQTRPRHFKLQPQPTGSRGEQ